MPRQPDYNSYIKQILSNGPKLGTEISDLISLKFNRKKAHSRKILSRAKEQGQIYDSSPLLFNNGQLGYSLDSNPSIYLELIHNKPALEAAYNLLKKRTFISELDILKVSGVSNRQETKYYDLIKLTADLKYLCKYFKVFEYKNTLFYSINKFVGEIREDDYPSTFVNRYIEVQMLPMILSYCRKINILNQKPRYSSVAKPFEGVETRQGMLFDAIGFTSVGNPNKEKSLCVMDICFGDFQYEQYQGFKRRVDILVYSAKKYNQRIIPIFAVNRMSFALRNKLQKENTILLLELTTMFGQKIEPFLKLLESNNLGTLTNKALDIIEIVENTGFADLLVRFFPWVFEKIVNDLVGQILNINLNSRKLTLSDGSHKQYDGFYDNGNVIYAVESKYHSRNLVKWSDCRPKNYKDTLKYFFSDKYEFLKKWCKENKHERDIKMIFISARGFYKDVDYNAHLIPADIVESRIGSHRTIEELISLCKRANIPIKEYEEFIKPYFIKKEKRNKKEEELCDDVDAH